MHLHDDGTLSLSPSDVTAFLACEHLTTLSLAAAAASSRGRTSTNEQAELIFRKGDEHERAYLESSRAASRRRPRDRVRAGSTGTRRRRATLQAMRDGRRRRLPGRLRDGGWRGVADFLLRVESRPSSAPGATRRSTRSSRAREAGVHPPALLLQRAARRGCRGASRSEIHVLLGSGEQASRSGRRSSAPTTGACARGSSEFVADPPATEPYPIDHCGICDFKPLCDAHWDESTTSRASPASAGRRSRSSTAAGITTLAGARRARRAEPAPAGIGGDDVRRSCASRPSSSCGRASTAHDRFVAPAAAAGERASRCCPTPRPATSSSTSRATRSGTRTGASSTSGASSTPSGSFTPLRAHDHDDRARRVRDVRRPRPRAARRATPTCTSTTTRRTRSPRSAADGPLRHARGRARRSAAPRASSSTSTRSSATAIRASRPGYGLKELEAFLDFQRQRRGQGRRHLDRRLRAVDADARPGAARRRSTRTTTRTASRRCCCATGCSSGARRRSAEFGPFPPPEPDEPKPVPPERRPSAPRSAAALLDAGEELAAQLLDYHDRERKPVWWAFFDRLEMTPDELVEDAESIGRLELVGEPEQVTKRSTGVHVHVPGAGAQARPGQEHVRPGDAASRRARSSSSTARRGGSCSSAARRSKDVPLPAGAHPRAARTTPTTRRTRSSGSAARCSPATSATRRSSRSCAASRSTAPIQTTDLDEMKALVLSLDGRHLVIQGPPGLGQDVDVGPADRAPARARQARRRRLDEPQGDPQPARRGRGGGRRARARLPRR